MGNVLKKNFLSTVCPKCDKVINIGYSKVVRQIVAKNKTLSQQLRATGEMNTRLYKINSKIQKMHECIGRMRDIMTDKQKEKVRKISKEIRDEFRWKKK